MQKSPGVMLICVSVICTPAISAEAACQSVAFLESVFSSY